PSHIAVNVTVTELFDHDVLAAVEHLVRDPRMPVDGVWVEVPEDAVAAHRGAALDRLGELAATGALVVIDDLDMRSASLRDIGLIAPHGWKLDPALISGSGHPGLAETAITRAFLKLAHSLGVAVIADGVVTTEQADALADLGCQFGQGPVWSGPLDGSVVLDWIGRNRSRALGGGEPAGGLPPGELSGPARGAPR
ncbi:MAG TPA: EAL domain-containing protein, partial [Acidimicrobiales bacterium]|nr:EAL domain-containing protein [Acidimicrobiales bacterium]